MIQKFKRKPIIVETIQWDGNNKSEIDDFLGYVSKLKEKKIIIRTLEGDMLASVGDFIIKGVNGEFHPIKPNILNKTYTPV